MAQAKVKEKVEEKVDPEGFFISPRGHVRDRIIIHESEKFPKNGIFLSLNGFPFLAKAGEPIDIPRPVRLMLDTLVTTETIHDKDGAIIDSRDIPRITYTLVKEGVNLPGADAEAAFG